MGFGSAGDDVLRCTFVIRRIGCSWPGVRLGDRVGRQSLILISEPLPTGLRLEQIKAREIGLYGGTDPAVLDLASFAVKWPCPGIVANGTRATDDYSQKIR